MALISLLAVVTFLVGLADVLVVAEFLVGLVDTDRVDELAGMIVVLVVAESLVGLVDSLVDRGDFLVDMATKSGSAVTSG